MEQMSYPQRTAYFNAIGYAAWENIFGIWQLGTECLTEVRLMDMMDMITLPSDIVVPGMESVRGMENC